ncbi:MAG: HAD family hydrolase, partial [Pseudomonadota bacterium]
DGCLSIGKGQPFDIPLITALREKNSQLASQGIGLTLCTGRPQPYAEAVAQLLAIDLPIVCEGGAMLYEPSTDTYRPLADSISLRGIADIKAAISASDILTDTLYFEVGNDCSICLTGPDIAEKDHAIIRDKMDSLMARFADFPVSWSHSTTSVDITPHGISKGTGVRTLSAELGVDLAQTASIGDSNGDVGMFKVAARGYCPSNASDELKSLAVYVSAHAYMAGTLDILHRIEADSPFS